MKHTATSRSYRKTGPRKDMKSPFQLHYSSAGKQYTFSINQIATWPSHAVSIIDDYKMRTIEKHEGFGDIFFRRYLPFQWCWCAGNWLEKGLESGNMKSTVSTDHFNKQICTRALCTFCTTIPTFLGMIYSWQILSSLWPTQNTRKVAKKRRENDWRTEQ